MAYCYENAIPYSEFMGRPVFNGKSRWLESDVDRVLAYEYFRFELCPHCGTKDSDWVDDKGRWLDDPLYEAVTKRCFGCEEVARLRESVPSDQKGVYTHARKKKRGEEPEILRREREMEMGIEEQNRLDSLPGFGDGAQ